MTMMQIPNSEIERSSASEVLATGGAMMQTRSSYATAVQVQRPRSLTQVMRRLEEEAALAGEGFYYGWGAGKDRIEGPSIELAQSAARCWGNCAIEMLPIQETIDAWIFTAVFVDLETGFTLPRQFRQSKNWTVHGKLDLERKADIRFQIGQSKAIRNVILNALPGSLINKAMDRAKSGVMETIERLVKEKGMAAAIDIAYRALAKVGVKEERILPKLGIVKREGTTVEHLVILSGDLRAIQTGQETAEALFPNGADKIDRLNDALKPHPGDTSRVIDTTTSNLPPTDVAEEILRNAPRAPETQEQAEQDVAGEDAEEPPIDLSTFEGFAAAFRRLSLVTAGLSQEKFDVAMARVCVDHRIKQPGIKGDTVRKYIYEAAANGALDWSTGKIV